MVDYEDYGDDDNKDYDYGDYDDHEDDDDHDGAKVPPSVSNGIIDHGLHGSQADGSGGQSWQEKSYLQSNVDLSLITFLPGTASSGR